MLNRMQRTLNIGAVLATVVAFGCIIAKNMPTASGERLLNVSYDPTRELYQALNAEFIANYKSRTGRTLTIVQSHGGSSRQARAVISGEQPADETGPDVPTFEDDNIQFVSIFPLIRTPEFSNLRRLRTTKSKE